MYRPGSLIKYFGSKYNLIKYYPKPIYSEIEESFAGSAPYSLRYWWLKITINDIDPNLSGLWTWLRAATPNDIISIPTNLPIGTNLLNLMFAPQADLVRRWQRTGRNNCWTVSQWNGRPGLWNETVRARIASDLVCIKHWNITSLPYHELPNIECTHFVDPVYEGMGSSYEYGSTIDYDHLAHWCKTRLGQVIVCEREGAKWLPFKPLAKIKNLKREECGEVYWTNME